MEIQQYLFTQYLRWDALNFNPFLIGAITIYSFFLSSIIISLMLGCNMMCVIVLLKCCKSKFLLKYSIRKGLPKTFSDTSLVLFSNNRLIGTSCVVSTSSSVLSRHPCLPTKFKFITTEICNILHVLFLVYHWGWGLVISVQPNGWKRDYPTIRPNPECKI